MGALLRTSTFRNADTHRRRLYGLTLDANRSIPGLAPADAGSEVDLRVEYQGHRIRSRMPGTASNWQMVGAVGNDEAGSVRLLARESGAGTEHLLVVSGPDGFSVEFAFDPKARQITVTWSNPRQRDENIDSLLLGPGMRCLLHLRGATSLHAGAVTIAGRAVAIVGSKGAGKSTTVAYLARLGHRVSADDVTVLLEAGGLWQVSPGPARMALWPGTLAALGMDWRALPTVLSPGEKRSVQLSFDASPGPFRFESEPRPLAAIYVLGEQDPGLAEPAIEQLSAADGLLHLLDHAQGWMPNDAEARTHGFTRISLLAQRVPIRKVQRPVGLDAVPALAEAIVADQTGAMIADPPVLLTSLH
jgi:energy-coupling factor transporter ATP-binding protein EcfA2